MQGLASALAAVATGLALFTFSSSAFAAWDLQQLMDSLAQHKSGRATFVETKRIAMLDKPVESSGELVFVAPDRLEKRTLKPKPESMIVNGDALTLERGSQKRQMQLQAYPEVAAFIDSIRGTLAGDRKALERSYRLSLDGSADGWTLQLVPRGRKDEGRGAAHPDRRGARPGEQHSNHPGRWRQLADGGDRIDNAAMMASRRRGVPAIVLWLAFLLACAVIIARTHFTTDLSAFLPRAPTPEQKLLMDQLRDGLASRLILVGIEGADAPERARLSRQTAQRLRADPAFVTVNNGEPVNTERDRAFLFDNRYLLSPAVTPERFSEEGLHAALSDSIDLLASPAGLLVKSMLPRDPTGEMVRLLEQLGSRSPPKLVDGAWASGDGSRALMLVQTRAAGSDTDAQEQRHGRDPRRRSIRPPAPPLPRNS